MKTRIKIVLLAGLFAGSFASCDNPLAYQEDAHGRGKQKLYIEESYKPLFETAIYTFEGQFPKANLVPDYCTEGEAIQALFKNKTNTICITRDLTKEEKDNLRKALIEVRSSHIAFDAVALIIHPSNPDSMITVDELKQVLTGKMNKWPKGSQPINVVFDQVNSANFNYLHNLAGKGKVPENVFAVKSNEEVIKYVKDHPSALGIIGVNWISDEDDKVVQKYRSQVKQMWVAKNVKTLYFQPYQGSIQSKDYPLIREVWLLNKGSRSGLNTGFVNWMEKENGQLLVQKAGLIAAEPVERNLSISTE